MPAPVSLRFARQRPSSLRERFCPDVGPVFTTGPPVLLGGSDEFFLSAKPVSLKNGQSTRKLPTRRNGLVRSWPDADV